MIPCCTKISGPTCYLRTVKKGDVKQWHQWFNDQDVLKYSLHRGKAITYEEQLAFFNSLPHHPTKVQFAICAVNSDTFVGIISLDINAAEGSVSIIIGKKQFWGKGLATAAIALIIKYAQDYTLLRRLYAGCDTRNKGSEYAFKKNNFVDKEIFKNDISYIDDERAYDRRLMMLKLS
jgi:RimJ/RimL family protein N-acetyltransferase